MAEIVVIGAGPAGLMAALRSARSGHRCTVVEAEETVGGMAGSFDVAGQRVDYGSHRLHPATPERFLELFRSTLGPDLQVRPRNGRIRLHGRWVAFPLRAGDMVCNLPPAFSSRAALDAVAAPLRRRRSARPTTFVDEVARRLGPTVAREFYAPYARKLYGVAADRLDRELARRRVSATGAGEVLRRVMRAARPQGRSFLYPRRGYGQLSEALADLAIDLGVDLRLGTRVLGLRPADDAVSVCLDGRVLDADAVLTTMPAPALASAVDPPPPPAVVEALDRCRTRAVVLAYLVVGRDRFAPFDAHYFPGPETVISRLSEPKNYRDGDDPPGRTVLCAEIPCWPGDELWHCSEDQLGELVAGDMERSGLEMAELEGVEVRRLPAVYPVYETSTTGDRATVDAWLRSLIPARIVSLGRHGLGVLDNLHHVLAMGEAAAAALGPDGAVDQVAWHESLDGFASHIVED